MKRGATGRYETATSGGEAVRAFVPSPLPPAPLPLLEGELQLALERAHLALGRLDSVSTLLPDTALFLYAYVRKEAVLSSQIEGTQSSLSDLLLFELDELPGVPLDDVVEVSNYVAALDHGLARLREGFPLSNRLIREIHAVLLSKGRGSGKEPGEFRRSQNWIGGSRPGNAIFVPPPPGEVLPAMSDLERFLHDDTTATSRSRPGRPRSRAVRDDPPVPRRERPRGAAPDHPPPVSLRCPAGAPPVPQPLPQAVPDAPTTATSMPCGRTATGRRGSTSFSRA